MNGTLRVAIALGSNSPDRAALLQSAHAALQQLRTVTVVASSGIENTQAFGPRQPSFLNQMVLVETSLQLTALLHALQRIEQAHGRERLIAKGPRTLDLDIVWAGPVVITGAELLVPHPGLNDRDFWQRELIELLGTEAGADAIASAQVHAGMDTARQAGHAS